jgi:hypothetical protein
MEGDLVGELTRQGRALLASYPWLRHSWEDTAGGGVRLTLPRADADGFEVSLEAQAAGLIVSGVGFHTHFDWYATAGEAVRQALGLVRDLLSPGMRVRELRASGRPYRWELQRFDGGEWRTQEVTGLLFWNYFGARSQRIYQNMMLPPRGSPA